MKKERYKELNENEENKVFLASNWMNFLDN